ncbi:MAG: hypothetical protein MZW92_32515 [Comamonadaceae bacterium]|nr:hypothetical protein [Comamonadaceae bacterium]
MIFGVAQLVELRQPLHDAVPGRPASPPARRPAWAWASKPSPVYLKPGDVMRAGHRRRWASSARRCTPGTRR